MSPLPIIGGLFQKPNAHVQRQQTKQHGYTQPGNYAVTQHQQGNVTHARKASEVGISDSDIMMVDAWTRSKEIDIPSNLAPKQKSGKLNFFA